MMRRPRLRDTFVLAVAGAFMAGAAHAQPPGGSGHAGGAVALEAVGGYAGFLDESTLHNAVVGGAGRFRVSPRLWTGAELLYMWGPGGEHTWLVMPLVSLDLAQGRVVPYLVAGVGGLRITEIVGTGPYTSWSWAVGGGAGLRLAAGRRAYVAFEGRLGTEPLTRATVAIGWRPW
jgi:hypothetical protein